MKAPLLGLLLFAAAPAQDDLAKSCEALYERITAIDPDERAKARADLIKLVAANREALRTAAPLALALSGDGSALKEIAKLLDGDASPTTRAAAEAMGGIAPDGAADRLLKLLEHEDLKIGLAAARSVSRAKAPAVAKSLQGFADKPEQPRRKVLACYALGLNEPGHIPPILAQAESATAAVREAAWAALANLPGAVDDFKKRARDEAGEKELRKLFETSAVSDEVRDAFGKQMVRAGIYAAPDLVGMIGHNTKEIAAWARRATADPLLVRKCVFIAALLRSLATFENEADETKEPIPTLEGMLAEQGIKAEGNTLKERIASFRAAWEKTRITVIDKDVNGAIDAGVALLRSRQLPDGSWKFCVCGVSPNDAHANGTTALAVYTLLKCDVPVRDKAVASGLDYLLGKELPNHTYTVSLQAMAFAEAFQMLLPPKKTKPPPEDLAAMNKYLPRLRESATWLVEAQTKANRGGYECGDWDYVKAAATNMDNSNSQFAVLGLRAAQNAGVPIPERTWARSLNHWQFDQNKDGSWPYRKDPKNPNQGGTRSMSAAGFYCWIVSYASLRRKDPVTLVGEAPVKKGLEHFKKGYPVPEPHRDRSRGHVHSPYYDLYSLERAMMIAKIDKIDGKDWYHDGALFILTNQSPQGEWIDATDTCFALLFLKRAFVGVITGEPK